MSSTTDGNAPKGEGNDVEATGATACDCEPSGVAWSVASLVLRMLTALFTVASAIVIAVTSYTSIDPNSSSGQEATFHFQDFCAYRYGMSVAIIGMVYAVVQVAIAIYRLVAVKDFPNWVSFIILYGDVLVALWLVSGSAATFGLTVDFQRKWDSLLDELVKQFRISPAQGDDWKSSLDKAASNNNMAASFLLLGAVFSLLVTYPTLAKFKS